MKILCTIILASVLFTACHNKSECDNYQPAKIIQPIPELAQFSFNPGTYWVYLNPQSQQLDSQVVTSNTVNTYQSSYPSPCDGGTTLQTNNITVYSYLNYYETYYMLIGGGLYKNTAWSQDYTSARLIYAGNQLYGNNETELIAVLPTLTLNGNTFTNVTKVVVHPTSYPSVTPNISSNNVYMYFAEGVGLIKQEEDLGDGNTVAWEIKSYHIQ